MVPYVNNNNMITVFIDGSPITIASTHIHWRKLKKALVSENTIENIKNLMDVKKLLYKGAYYIYKQKDRMFCLYSSPKDGISISYPINNFKDVYEPSSVVETCPIPENSVHVGTYASVDDVLTDFAERWI